MIVEIHLGSFITLALHHLGRILCTALCMQWRWVQLSCTVQHYSAQYRLWTHRHHLWNHREQKANCSLLPGHFYQPSVCTFGARVMCSSKTSGSRWFSKGGWCVGRQVCRTYTPIIYHEKKLCLWKQTQWLLLILIINNNHCCFSGLCFLLEISFSFLPLNLQLCFFLFSYFFSYWLFFFFRTGVVGRKE